MPYGVRDAGKPHSIAMTLTFNRRKEKKRESIEQHSTALKEDRNAGLLLVLPPLNDARPFPALSIIVDRKSRALGIEGLGE